MAPKKKRPRYDTAPSQGPYDGPKFWGDGRIKYDKYFSKRPVITSRDMALGNSELLSIERMFTGRGWDSMLKGAEHAYIRVVQEFYSNFMVTDDACSESVTFLRGRELRVSRAFIAELLNNPIVENPDYSLNRSPPNFPDFEIIARRICIPGSSWTTGSVKVSQLDTPFRIIYHLVCANIIPKKRTCEVVQKLASFIYAFSTGLSMDLPSIIFTEIRYNAEAKVTQNGLPYGSYITHLAREVGVRMSEHDGIEYPMGLITHVSLSRSKAQTKAKPNGFTSTPEPSSSRASLVPDLPASQFTLAAIYSALVVVGREVMDLRARFDAVHGPPFGDLEKDSSDDDEEDL